MKRRIRLLSFVMVGKLKTEESSGHDSKEKILNEYTFGKAENPTVCTCIFCSTYSFTEPNEEVLKDQVTKLGKENIPACRTKMLHPERKFFRYASLREKIQARAKNERVYANECSSSDEISEDEETDTDEWSTN